MRNSVFRHCNNGITAGNNIGQGNGRGPGKAVVLDVRDSVIADNAKYGIHFGAFTPLDTLRVRVAGTRVSGNAEPGASFEAQALAIGGVAHSTIEVSGGNCLFGNGSGDVEATNLPVLAGRDWWGQAGGPRAGQTVTHGLGRVSTPDGLGARPRCGAK
jgi:hypothetical protein